MFKKRKQRVTRLLNNFVKFLPQFLSKSQQVLKINIDNIIIKFIWKNKGNRIAKTIVIWKNKAKGTSLPHFKTYIATVIKTWMVLTEE